MPLPSRSALHRSHQAGVAAGCGRVDAGDALGGEAGDVVGAAGLGAGSAEAFAAERLAFDHRADLVAVDVEVADPSARLDEGTGGVDPALQPQRQAEAAGVDLVYDLAELARFPADDVEDWPEMLAI